MPTFTHWFPVAVAGTVLTVFGLLKLYGLCRGIVCDRSRPFAERLVGG